MRKLIKNNFKIFITFVITSILFTSIGVYAGVQYLAKDISFSSDKFKATNVGDALDELYDIANNADKIYDDLIGVSWHFDYTGDEQTFNAPLDGTYKLEIWGAQGGSYQATGGYGAYSTGKLYLSKNDIIYLNIGGIGSYNGSIASGGYNGGGNSGASVSGSGGGATHISAVSGILKELELYKGDFDESSNTYISKEIYMVAGGGGCTGCDTTTGCSNGGNAGGISGSINTTEYGGCLSSSDKCYGGAGTQLTGGIKGTYSGYSAYSGGFGYGGNGKKENIGTGNGGGGGSGWYGGGGATYNSGGGGSSYIGNSLLTDKAMYCYNCEESSKEATKTISNTCVKEIPTS